MTSLEHLTPGDVEFEIEKRAVDTVLVAFPDVQGRLVGRRIAADFYGASVSGGIRVPSYLMATDSSGRVSPGYPLASPETGFPDLVVKVDTTTYFRMPWQPGTVGVLGDLESLDGTPLAVSPRAVLKLQAQRLETAGMAAHLGTEPQFTVFSDAHADGVATGFTSLISAGAAGSGHLAFRSARTENLMHTIRKAAIDMPVHLEGTAGLHGAGHFEVTLRSGDVVATCDNTAIVRDAIKEITAQEGMSATFMAAPMAGSASAGHMSISARGARGGSAFADHYGDSGMSEIGKAFVAGLLEHAAELCLLYAPNVNSYRRFRADVFTPSALNWGLDNRTCAIRVVGSEASMRIENRIPGSDANPYLVAAAMIAAGLDGVSRQLRVPPAVTGDGHHDASTTLPASLAEALDAWHTSSWVRSTFGAEVQQHYAVMARLEIEAAGVSPDLNWERGRYFDGC